MESYTGKDGVKRKHARSSIKRVSRLPPPEGYKKENKKREGTKASEREKEREGKRQFTEIERDLSVRENLSF